MRRLLILGLLFCGVSHAYPPAAGQVGTDAISATDSRFVNWANGNLPPIYGSGVDATWKTPAKALGPATGGVYDIVCLGNGGTITMYFPHPIRDGDGPDLAVFENSFSDTFLELAFVEASSDGVNFYRFPNVSLTANPVGAFGITDPTRLSGLAGKYRAGYGTPFDLAEIPNAPLLDREHVRFIRIVDIIGDGNTTDTPGHPIYDPTPTTGSGGFDLEAVGVIHQNDGAFQITRCGKVGGNFEIRWESNPGSRYRLETSSDLGIAAPWVSSGELPASQTSNVTQTSILAADPKRFWRLVRVE